MLGKDNGRRLGSHDPLVPVLKFVSVVTPHPSMTWLCCRSPQTVVTPAGMSLRPHFLQTLRITGGMLIWKAPVAGQLALQLGIAEHALTQTPLKTISFKGPLESGRNTHKGSRALLPSSPGSQWQSAEGWAVSDRQR